MTSARRDGPAVPACPAVTKAITRRRAIILTKAKTRTPRERTYLRRATIPPCKARIFRTLVLGTIVMGAGMAVGASWRAAWRRCSCSPRTPSRFCKARQRSRRLLDWLVERCCSFQPQRHRHSRLILRSLGVRRLELGAKRVLVQLRGEKGIPRIIGHDVSNWHLAVEVRNMETTPTGKAMKEAFLARFRPIVVQLPAISRIATYCGRRSQSLRRLLSEFSILWSGYRITGK